MNKKYLYSARDTSTGKLVSDITNPVKKYWQNKKSAEDAIYKYNNKLNYYGKSKNYGKLELVTWELVEVKEDDNY